MISFVYIGEIINDCIWYLNPWTYFEILEIVEEVNLYSSYNFWKEKCAEFYPYWFSLNFLGSSLPDNYTFYGRYQTFWWEYVIFAKELSFDGEGFSSPYIAKPHIRFLVDRCNKWDPGQFNGFDVLHTWDHITLGGYLKDDVHLLHTDFRPFYNPVESYSEWYHCYYNGWDTRHTWGYYIWHGRPWWWYLWYPYYTLYGVAY